MSISGIGLFFAYTVVQKIGANVTNPYIFFCYKKHKSEEQRLNVRIGAKNRPIKLKTNRVLSPVVRGISQKNTIPISVKR